MNKKLHNKGILSKRRKKTPSVQKIYLNSYEIAEQPTYQALEVPKDHPLNKITPLLNTPSFFRKGSMRKIMSMEKKGLKSFIRMSKKRGTVFTMDFLKEQITNRKFITSENISKKKSRKKDQSDEFLLLGEQEDERDFFEEDEQEEQNSPSKYEIQ